MNNKTNKSYKQLILYIYISHVNMIQTVPDISPLMPMHQDPLLVCIWNAPNRQPNHMCHHMTVSSADNHRWFTVSEYAKFYQICRENDIDLLYFNKHFITMAGLWGVIQAPVWLKINLMTFSKSHDIKVMTLVCCPTKQISWHSVSNIMTLIPWHWALTFY